MNWEAIGAIGEVLGAIFVFATLVYLSLQVRSNSRQLKSQNLHAATNQKQQWLSLQADPAMAAVIEKMVDRIW